jgi:hypothetical protein
VAVIWDSKNYRYRVDERNRFAVALALLFLQAFGFRFQFPFNRSFGLFFGGTMDKTLIRYHKLSQEVNFAPMLEIIQDFENSKNL